MCNVRKRDCEMCKGVGMVEDWADDAYGNSIGFTHPCDYCEGEGTVTEHNITCEDCGSTAWVPYETGKCRECRKADILKDFNI